MSFPKYHFKKYQEILMIIKALEYTGETRIPSFIELKDSIVKHKALANFY